MKLRLDVVGEVTLQDKEVKVLWELLKKEAATCEPTDKVALEMYLKLRRYFSEEPCNNKIPDNAIIYGDIRCPRL